jgi:hypothetical protein
MRRRRVDFPDPDRPSRPTLIASAAAAKNQPPDMDIIMFRTGDGIAIGALPNRSVPGDKAESRRSVQSVPLNYCRTRGGLIFFAACFVNP